MGRFGVTSWLQAWSHSFRW